MVAIRKTIILREDDGELLLGETIEYEGKLWIVPAWLPGPTQGTERPVRIICVDGLLSEPPEQYQGKADFYLSTPLSKETLEAAQ
jgi:hypothetical protein